jgi:uncharacterized protein
MRFNFTPQNLDGFPQQGGTVLFLTPEGLMSFALIERLDRTANELDLVWNAKNQESGWLPAIVVLHDWIRPDPKPAVLSQFAADLLDEEATANPVTLSLLSGELPCFVPGGGPPDGVFTDDLGEMTRWVTGLDHSYVAIQGPPGTGKTYSAAHLVHTLILAGARVGITAMTHAAIDNLMGKILEVFTDHNDLDTLNAIRKSDVDTTHPRVTATNNNNRCARTEFNLVAGTTWLFASEAMRAAPVDV